MCRINKSPLSLWQGSPITISWWRWIGAFLPTKLLPLVWCPQHWGDKCLCSLIIKHKQIVWGIIGLSNLSLLHFSSFTYAWTHTRTQLHAQNKRTMKKQLPTTSVDYQILCLLKIFFIRTHFVYISPCASAVLFHPRYHYTLDKLFLICCSSTTFPGPEFAAFQSKDAT